MSTYKLMEHERMRWRTMTDKQLITRLGKITTMEKLECFARLCHESSDRHYLLQHVENRQRQLMGLLPGDWSKPKVSSKEEVFQQAKESFYEKATGEKYSQPKDGVAVTVQKGLAEKIVADMTKELKKKSKSEICDERYLDF